MVWELFDLTGRVAVVTGASRGLGRAMAVGMAKAGASMVLVSRNLRLLEETAEFITARGAKAIVTTADVSSEKDMENMADVAMKEFGKIDILVNNAGIAPMNTAMNISAEEWKMVMDTNLNSVFYACRAVGRQMIEAKSGKIINISSIVGIRGNTGQCNYSASKAGLIGLTKSLAREVASRNVMINAIAPGYIETEMTGKLDEKIKEKLLTSIPTGKLGSPEDVAMTALFLASKDSDYMTGAVLSLDGGMGI